MLVFMQSKMLGYIKVCGKDLKQKYRNNLINDVWEMEMELFQYLLK